MRNLKKIIFVIVIATILVVSFITRKSITDNYNTEEARKEFLVPYFPKEISGLCKGIEKKLDKSPIIIIGKATGNSQYVFRNFIQEVQVLEVIKGEDKITADSKVKLTGCGSIGYEYDENEKYKDKAGKVYVDTNFLNYMIEGDKYLIFIGRKVNVSYDSVYELNTQAISLQYLNLSRDVYEVCTPANTNGDVCDIPYKEVRYSEFATDSDKVMENWINTKKKLIAKYVKSNEMLRWGK